MTKEPLVVCTCDRNLWPGSKYPELHQVGCPAGRPVEASAPAGLFSTALSTPLENRSFISAPLDDPIAAEDDESIARRKASAPAAPPDISGEFCSIHGWAVDWDEVHKERFCKKCRAGEPPLNSPSQTSPTDAAIEEAVRVARKALAAWEHWYSVDSTEFNRDTARDMGLSALTTLDAILPILRSGK